MGNPNNPNQGSGDWSTGIITLVAGVDTPPLDMSSPPSMAFPSAQKPMVLK